MQEKNLLRVAMLCSIIGIFILIIISNSLEPEKLSINEITEEYVGQIIKTEGAITSIKTTEEFTVLEIEDKTGKMKVIAYEELDLREDNEILVEGIVKEYKDELEIEADKIKII